MPILFPGTVAWSGENPGISLKTDPAGPFTSLASFFRVVWSPLGRGHTLVLMQSPQSANPPPEAPNLCLTDNEPLARMLVADYVHHFGAFRGIPGLAALRYVGLDHVETAATDTNYCETVTGAGLVVRLDWSGLGAPFAFALAPEESATGLHHMPTVFVGCGSATIEVNGQALPGAPIPREIAGQRITTAMLAFSESWVRV